MRSFNQSVMTETKTVSTHGLFLFIYVHIFIVFPFMYADFQLRKGRR